MAEFLVVIIVILFFLAYVIKAIGMFTIAIRGPKKVLRSLLEDEDKLKERQETKAKHDAEKEAIREARVEAEVERLMSEEGK